MKFKQILENQPTQPPNPPSHRPLPVPTAPPSPPPLRPPPLSFFPPSPSPPYLLLSFDGQSFAGRASLVSDDSLCKKISQLKYDDEKRANEPRVVLEVDYN